MRRVAMLVVGALMCAPVFAQTSLTTVTTQAKTDIEANVWIVAPIVFGLLALFIGIRLAWTWLRRAARS